MRRRAAVVAALGVVLSLAAGVDAYLKLGTIVGGRVVPLAWTRQPIRYFVKTREVPAVSPAQLESAVSRAFATWTSTSTAAVSSEFAGFTNAEPFADDGLSVIGFQNRPELDDVLGSTTFTVDEATG